MVGESTGKLDRVGTSRTLRLTIPADLASDTSFPFEPGEKVKIEIIDGELRVKNKD